MNLSKKIQTWLQHKFAPTANTMEAGLAEKVTQTVTKTSKSWPSDAQAGETLQMLSLIKHDVCFQLFNIHCIELFT